jgi:transposase
MESEESVDDRTFYQTVLGLPEPWVVESVELRPGNEEVWIRVGPRPGAALLCPECGAESPGYDRAEERRWRHLNTMQYHTILVCRVPRVRCTKHGVRQARVPWAEERSRFTALFEWWTIQLLRESTVAGVAELLHLSWDEVAHIQRRAVERGMARRSTEPIRVLGVDETSFQKRHEYVTVINDLEGDRVLWVGDHRREATLREFWESRPIEERRALRAVVMDMWDPYIAATRDGVPHGLSKIVFDRYHVVAHLTAAVSDVRKAEQRELQRAGDAARAAQLKGKRFTLVKGKARRTAEDEAEIQALRKAGFKVGRAWSIKEAANTIWQCATAKAALAEFNKWYGWAIRSRLAPVKRAARMMKRYLYGILKYTRHPFTNARTEGMNSKIQLIKHRARGYRNRENFRNAILFHCGGLDMNPC